MNKDGDPSGSSREKSWERSWTTDEMRQNAHAWSLAGDSGLLKHLQELSQTVLAHTHTTEKALDSLVEEIDTTASEINTTNNKFLCLANTQFVENRVYDDDEKESPQDVPCPEKKSKEESEALMLQKVREALSMSVAVLDTMFEPIEIQASDSEGEPEDNQKCSKTLLLEPHNPYMHRPLPHLIGSDAFMSDDCIGLGDSPSDSEELKPGIDDNMETSSESDVDFTPVGITKRNRDLYSSQSSISENHILYPEASAKQSKKSKPSDMDSNLNNEEEDSLQDSKPISKPMQNDDFAAQLAAKLGKIASPPANMRSSVEKSSKNQSEATSDDIFGQQLSDDEDALFSGGSGLFSGPPKLFDDLDDANDSLWGPKPGRTSKNLQAGSTKSEIASNSIPNKKEVVDDLFSQNMSDEEDDLFSTKVRASLKTAPKETVKQSSQANSESLDTPNQRHLNVDGLRPGMTTSTPGKHLDVNQGKPGFSENSNPNQTREVSVSDVPVVSDFDKTDLTSVPSSVSKENGSSHDKKPAGGVLMFGQTNILAGLKAKLPRRQSSSSSESSAPDHEDPVASLPVTESSNPIQSEQLIHGSSFESNNNCVQQSQNDRQASHNTSLTPTQTSVKLNSDESSDHSKTLPTLDKYVSENEDLFAFRKKQPVSGGLFANIYDEEDDLFGASPSFKSENTEKKPSFSQNTSNAPKPESPAVFANISKDVSYEEQKSYKQTLSSSPSNSMKFASNSEPRKNDIFSTVPPPLKSENKAKKPVSLFDDSDSGEDELLFSSASSAGSRRSQASSDVLANAAVSIIEKKPLSKKGLFDDDGDLFAGIQNENDPVIDIFSGLSKSVSKPSQSFYNTKSSEESRKSNSIPEIPNSNCEITQNWTSKVSAVNHLPETAKDLLKDNLFAENDDEDVDDLFSHKSISAALESEPTLDPFHNQNDDDDLFSDVSVAPLESERQAAANSNSAQLKHNPKSNNGNFRAANALPQPIPPKPSLNVNALEKVENSSPVVENDTNQDAKIQRHKDSIAEDDTKAKGHLKKNLKKPEPPRTLNIRKVTDPGLGFLAKGDEEDDDDNLFSSSTTKVGNSSVTLPVKPPIKPNVAAKPEAAQISKAAQQKFNEYDQSIAADKPNSESCEVDGVSSSVSKLKESLLAGVGLKIDPLALLPGKKPPPRQTSESSSRPPEAAETKESPRTIENQLAIGFDQPILNSTTLPSANRARAKLGVKRRPPSSKARREAARASLILEQSDNESPVSSTVISPAEDLLNDVDSNIVSNNSVLSPSTDEDDLFGVPQDLPPEYDSQSLPPTDIFSGAPILSPIVPVNHDKQVLKTFQKEESKENQKEEINDQRPNKKEPVITPHDVPGTLSSELLFEEERVLKLSISLPTHHQSLSSEESSSSKLFLESPPEDVIVTQDLQRMPNVHDSQSNHIESVSVPPIPVSSDSSNLEDSEPESHTSKSVQKVHSSNDQTVILKDSSLLTSVKTSGENPAIDPLNNAEELSKSDDDSLFQTSGDSDDHSSLFSFVKKRPETKQGSNHPLFSETPTLPSKADKPILKPTLSSLVDDKEDDLFLSSSKLTSGKKTEDPPKNIISEKVKKWQFSDDEDDDDLFLSGAKTISSNPSSSKSNSSASSSVGKVSTQTHTTAPLDVKKINSSTFHPKNGLFDEENDDDLFSKPSQPLRSKRKDGENAAKSSLFDDGDDDLFGSSRPTSSVVPETNMSKDASQQTSTITPRSTKPKKENIFDDPLMALHKSDY